MTKRDPDSSSATETRSRRSFLAVTGTLGATLFGIPMSAAAQTAETDALASRISFDEAVGYVRGRVNRLVDGTVGTNEKTADDAVTAVVAFVTVNSDSIVSYLNDHVPAAVEKDDYASWQIGFVDGELRTTRYLLMDVVDNRYRSLEVTETEPSMVDHAITLHNKHGLFEDAPALVETFHDEYVMTGTVPDQRVMAEFAGRYGVESICTVDGSRGTDVPCLTVLEST